MTATTLTPLEVASGLVLGSSSRPRTQTTAPPRRALEDAILAGLRRPPCLVSFSGGRDSSAVLAVATLVARREGLPLPVPATLRFPGADGTAESDWQEQVVTHLGLDEWFRLDATDELDCVGPVATASLARHGLLWPCNAHFHVPVLRAAHGGALLTGIGGDELLGPSRWTYARRVLGRRAAPRPRDALAVGLALAPPLLRRPVLRRRMHAPFPWLQAGAVDRLERGLAADEAAEPYGWSAGIRWRSLRRYLDVGTQSLHALAVDEQVELAHPLLSPGFVEALAALPRPARFSSRQEAMHLLFEDVLPAEVITRRTKAVFDGVFWHEHSRELVERWNGEGIDESFVDLERLRAEWTREVPDPRTYTLLQSVKLAVDLATSARDRAEQPLAGLVEPLPAVGPAELERR